MVTVREDGRERRVTAAEAFILQLTQKGLAGDSAAARASLTAIEVARGKRTQDKTFEIIHIIVTPHAISTTLRTLGIARKIHPRNEMRVRWELLPWIVEAALARLEPRQLTFNEQKEVWTNTLNPEKVAWPEWWTFRGA
jgi:hypothetical protein